MLNPPPYHRIWFVPTNGPGNVPSEIEAVFQHAIGIAKKLDGLHAHLCCALTLLFLAQRSGFCRRH
jgi:hypothetical protein